jgi:hypothetical protein
LPSRDKLLFQFLCQLICEENVVPAEVLHILVAKLLHDPDQIVKQRGLIYNELGLPSDRCRQPLLDLVSPACVPHGVLATVVLSRNGQDILATGNLEGHPSNAKLDLMSLHSSPPVSGPA